RRARRDPQGGTDVVLGTDVRGITLTIGRPAVDRRRRERPVRINRTSRPHRHGQRVHVELRSEAVGRLKAELLAAVAIDTDVVPHALDGTVEVVDTEGGDITPPVRPPTRVT